MPAEPPPPMPPPPMPGPYDQYGKPPTWYAVQPTLPKSPEQKKTPDADVGFDVSTWSRTKNIITTIRRKLS